MKSYLKFLSRNKLYTAKAAYTPAARYYVKECSKDKLVLSREEVNVDGPNLIEGNVTFRRMGLYTK